MYIEELKEGDSESGEHQVCSDLYNSSALVVWDPKKVLVGAGARALFYPTLLYNVVRNKIQSEFRWWDKVDEYVLLGAVPFPTDVPRLKALGVGGVVTLNEPYETLVPTSLYHDNSIEHLVIPTRDYLFAPSHGDICLAVEFIHDNALCGKTTYVHCKAGRGRSTTIVLCYLVKHKQMTPEAAFEHVRSIRPRVLLASSQWQAVQDYYHGVNKADTEAYADNLLIDFPTKVVEQDDFDENSLVVITESDLDGYDEEKNHGCDSTGKKMLAEVNLACKVHFASQAAISRLSCLWVTGQKVSRKKLSSNVTNGRIGTMGVDIHGFFSLSCTIAKESVWNAVTCDRSFFRSSREGTIRFCAVYKTCVSVSRYPGHGSCYAQPRPLLVAGPLHNMELGREQAKGSIHFGLDEKLKKRVLLTFLVGPIMWPTLASFGKTKKENPYNERRILEQNKRIQRENNVPDEFPNFVREGFTVKVVTSENYVTRDSGLILWDIAVGQGECPKAGQQVIFHYVGYNESGRRIDSTYIQGSPAKVRLGNNALIPGFEEGLRDMKPGGKRRLIIPPELGPPVGPSTFFSSKQFEVFDVELLSIQDCTRRTIGFYSDVVCS
ncbi:FKBP-like peptidyl-prolyl cis-trans isomerasefamily protein [Striga asiatica]|uniref:peptidylprolyl isomerase n=1 Tax=Striga asiatica TaxID=4170 RepID=A0A5A7PEN4_STRAF|nr:FKBP-like peptidyl-prolyl cis-trans isomerasefamily protein [Striga asiatica]